MNLGELNLWATVAAGVVLVLGIALWASVRAEKSEKLASIWRVLSDFDVDVTPDQPWVFTWRPTGAEHAWRVVGVPEDGKGVQWKLERGHIQEHVELETLAITWVPVARWHSSTWYPRDLDEVKNMAQTMWAEAMRERARQELTKPEPADIPPGEGGAA